MVLEIGDYSIKATCYNHGVKLEWAGPGDDSYLPENAPTISDFLITSTGPYNDDSNKWVDYHVTVDDPDYEDYSQGSNHLRVQLRYLDGANWIPFYNRSVNVMPWDGSYYTDSFLASNLPDGTWPIKAVVDDDMMETISTTTQTVTVDTTPPSTPTISSTHNENQWTNNNDPSFSWTPVSDASGVTYYYEWDHSSSTIPSSSSPSTTTTSKSYSNQADAGDWYFHVRAKDGVGNWGSTDHYGPVKIDATSPSAPTNLSPSGLLTVANSPYTINFGWATVTDLSGIQGGIYELIVDGTTYNPTTNSKDLPLTEGSHSWQVRAKQDGAGNYGEWSSASLTISLSTSPASVSGYVYTSGGSPISGATVTASGATITALPPQDTIKSGAGSSSPSPTSNPDPYSTTATTDEYGSYTLTGLTVSVTYDITASATGYNSQSASVIVGPNGAGYNFYLSTPSSSGGGAYDGSNKCFIGNTKIATPYGEVNIENISIGDDVLSFNEDTGTIESNKVSGISAHPPVEYLLINSRLGVTGEHMIYVNGGLKPAVDIRIGDVLTGLDGDVQVTSIEEITEPLEVYSIEVENNHNFYAEGLLVHNMKYNPFNNPGYGLCPFVYTWNGTDYVEDNNILPLSTLPDREELDVSDYYLLETDPVPKDGNYTFLLQEEQTYRSYFDKMELAVVDYPEGYEIGLASEGEWVTYTNDTIAPVSAVDSNGTDVLWSIIDEDTSSQELEINEFVVTNFGNFENIEEAKLIVKRRSVIPSITELLDDVIDWGYYLKHPIYVQILDDSGNWTDVGTMPTRINWATSVVNLTSELDYIRDGGDIRLLISGGIRQIDFVGLDVSETQNVAVNYYPPTYAVHQNDSTNMVDRILEQDGYYMVMDPFTSIEVTFPYQPETLAQRSVALVSSGYYFPVPEVNIEQPVRVQASILGGAEGVVSLWLEEIDDDGEVRGLIGQIIDLSANSNADIVLLLEQNPMKIYQLHARFDGCTEETKITAELTSFRGARTIEIEYSPDESSGNDQVFLLDDILWNITGVSFDRLSGRFQVLKDTLLQFDINEYYSYDTSNWEWYLWEFGDGLRTEDIRPTHVYETPGIYRLSMSAYNDVPDDGYWFFTSAWIEVVLSPPFAEIEAYQEVNITLRISGRKHNAVTCQIYEDGILIYEMPVTRTTGKPNEGTITFNKYLNRDYEIVLVYEASHRGANPTWLTFLSGDNAEEYFIRFNAKNGFRQEVIVETSYLDSVLEGNTQLYFDASNSYDIDGEIVSYEWDFGDGSTGSGMLVEHTFEEFGMYTITLVVTDDDGAVKETEYVLYINLSGFTLMPGKIKLIPPLPLGVVEGGSPLKRAPQGVFVNT